LVNKTPGGSGFAWRQSPKGAQPAGRPLSVPAASFSGDSHHLCGEPSTGARNVDWIIIHWFELSTLMLLCLNLWFVSAVLSTLRETNRWLSFLSNVQWNQSKDDTTQPRT
jgi:hypothetical protein